MTKSETAKVVYFIKSAYPGYYAKVSDEAFNSQIKAWHFFLGDYDFERVMRGVRSAVCAGTNGFPPSVDMIIEYMHRVENPGDTSAINAWSLVCKAVNSPRDQYAAAFSVLPETVKRVLGSPDTLLAWGNVDSEQFETVIQSNFLRSYEAEAKREYTDRKIPDSLKIALSRPEPKRIAQPKSVEYDDAFDSNEVEMPKSVSDRLAALKAKLGQ